MKKSKKSVLTMRFIILGILGLIVLALMAYIIWNQVTIGANFFKNQTDKVTDENKSEDYVLGQIGKWEDKEDSSESEEAG